MPSKYFAPYLKTVPPLNTSTLHSVDINDSCMIYLVLPTDTTNPQIDTVVNPMIDSTTDLRIDPRTNPRTDTVRYPGTQEDGQGTH